MSEVNRSLHVKFLIIAVVCIMICLSSLMFFNIPYHDDLTNTFQYIDIPEETKQENTYNDTDLFVQIDRDFDPWENIPRKLTYQDLKDFRRNVKSTETLIVTIGNNTIHVDEVDSIPSNKYKGIKDLLKSVTKFVKLPDVSFMVNVAPIPLQVNQNCNKRYGEVIYKNFTNNKGQLIPPVISPSKTDCYYDVLAPSPYFGNLNTWKKSMINTRNKASKIPWINKKKKLLWRGICGKEAYDRLKLVGSATSPYMDVGLVPGKKCPSDANKFLSTRRHNPERHFRNRLNFDKFLNYRLLINMPGGVSGTYSRGFQYLLLLGSPVLFWKGEEMHYEFFYRSLFSSVNIPIVNESNVNNKVEEIISDENELYAKKFYYDVRSWMEKNLTPINIALYWKRVLEKYKKLCRH